MALRNTHWAAGAFFLLYLGAAEATSKTHVCARALALYVSDEARAYTRTVIVNNSETLARRAGVDPEVFSRLYSADDILQDVQMQFLKGEGFDPGFHGDKETLALNNHLKAWIKRAVNQRILTLVAHTRRNSAREFRELPHQLSESGNWREVDIADRKLPATVLDLVSDRQDQGERITSDFTRPDPQLGITEEQWQSLLRLSARWVEAACEAQDTPIQLFWAHQGGYFTASDFAEELLEQTLLRLKTQRQILESDEGRNGIAEITAQKMVEELTGTLEVRERALSWMKNSSAKARNAALNYTLFYIDGLLAREMMDREGLDKAAVSYRKKTAQRVYFEFASVLLHYPPKLSVPSLKVELSEGEYLQVIEGIEAELGSTATKEKRLLALAEVQKALDTHFSRAGARKLKKAEHARLVKSAVARAIENL